MYRETVGGGELSIGGYISAMEIVTPGRARRVARTGRLTGKLGDVADL